ncbi:hypothetical protein JMN32_03485 [Fulvivirga sp. 29W222]|uniref:Uncharacterized protein n=1 Tax=Fulvivirga marina TaxID=2494733 RepID=A0A937KB29_9BACT|nr:hypothetical protein [Fulvivirga marina]MBL6445354.1 hypothetical protein [Fulvivirga marina]
MKKLILCFALFGSALLFNACSDDYEEIMDTGTVNNDPNTGGSDDGDHINEPPGN